MKKIPAILILLLVQCSVFAQDSTGVIEPGYETSFENKELWLVAVIGLMALVAVYFIFRSRKNRPR